jgi:hypothetical protein
MAENKVASLPADLALGRDRGRRGLRVGMTMEGNA